MKKKLSRKGAIEMSMTTIIIVVIGVTLLVLGIRFVVTTMSGISEQQAGIQAMSEKKLAEMFGESEDVISLPKGKVEIDQGDSEDVKVFVYNPTESKLTLKYKVSAQEGKEKSLDWLTWTDAGLTLGSGKGYEDTLTIDVPSTAAVGNYRFTLELVCGGGVSVELCESGAFEVLTVAVKGA